MTDKHRWTHSQTWPDEPRLRNTHRSINRDGFNVGRTFQHDGGPQGGQWFWSGYWYKAPHGVAETLADALNAVRDTYNAQEEISPPDFSHRVSRVERRPLRYKSF